MNKITNKIWLNFHHLLYFKKVTDENSMTQAAKKLNISQSALSIQLKQLENALGVVLFERKNKKLFITEEGRKVYEYANIIFNLGQEMVHVLQESSQTKRTFLNIGSLDCIPKQILLSLVQFSLKIAPCQIKLIEGSLEPLIQSLLSHQLDIVVTNYVPISVYTKVIQKKMISKKQVCFYGTNKFSYIKQDFPNSINKAPLLLPTYDSKLRFDIDQWGNEKKLDFDILIESQDISMKKLMAINGLGVIAVASHTVSRQINSGELIELGTLENVFEEIHLLSIHRKISNPISSKITDLFNLSI